MSLWPALKLLSYFKVMNDALSYFVTGANTVCYSSHPRPLSSRGRDTDTETAQPQYSQQMSLIVRDIVQCPVSTPGLHG